jgi:tetratricopeptide (TPR) repeat protein
MINPFNKYSDKYFIVNVPVSLNVGDNSLSESIQGNKISSLSTKRLFSDTNNESQSSSRPLKKAKFDQTSTVSFSGPENTFLKMYPQLQEITDPFAIEKIVVPGLDGQENVFYVRRISLAKISPVFERKISSGSWESCIWKKGEGNNKDSYYHLKAVGQVVLFALLSSGDVDSSRYQTISQTLETLENKEERLTVLEDILMLSDLYSIKGLRDECEAYIQSQMTSTQALMDYFDICVLLVQSPTSRLPLLWGKAVASLSAHELENVLVLFDELIGQIHSSLSLEKQPRTFLVLGANFALVAMELFKPSVELKSGSDNKGQINIENVEMFFKSALKIYYHFKDWHLALVAIRDAVRQCHSNHMRCPESSILYFLLASPIGRGGVVHNVNDEKKIDNTNDLHLIYLGLVCLREKKIEQAFDYFNLALQMRPDRAKLIECCKIQYFIGMRQLNEALKILEASQVDSHVLFAKGFCFYLQGEKKKALEVMNLALKHDRHNLNALSCIAKCIEYDKAFEVWNMILKDDRNNLSALLNRGIYFEKKGEYDKALNDWNLALKIWPIYTSALLARGNYYESKNEGNKALKDWDLILQCNPKNGEALHKRSSFLFKRSTSLLLENKIDEALKDLDAALDKDPDNFMIITARGQGFCGRGEWDKALADFNRILTHEPRNSGILGFRGKCYYGKGEWDKARADFELAVDIDPNDNLARMYLPLLMITQD